MLQPRKQELRTSWLLKKRWGLAFEGLMVVLFRNNV
jgi:hypothetical protein